MGKQELDARVVQIIEAYLKHEGVELVDLIYRYEGRDLYLRILADKPEGGISMEECAYLNAQISRILDGKDILSQPCILEVSSPGLDRPLVNKNDFLRCRQKRARFFLKEKINEKIELEGVIKQAIDESVEVELENGIVIIPLAQIAKAKQNIDTI